MRGLFDGELEELEGGTFERVPPSVARTLREAPPLEPLPPLPESLPGVELVLFDVDDQGRVRFPRSLATAPSLGTLASQRAAALDGLGRAASALAVLHEGGICHGDLGADALRVPAGSDGLLILVPGRRLAPGALLAARLQAGARPAITSFAAPEVVTGYEATPASDVYALAALAHEIITGRAPLGQIDFGEARQGPFTRLAAVVERGLAADPRLRPSAVALATALHEAAAVARALEQPAQVGPYRGSPQAKASAAPAQSPAEVSARKTQASSMSGILVSLLVLGGVFVFTGAMWLVGVTWSAMDVTGRFLLVVALTSGVLVTGATLGKKGYAGSGRALVVLGVELLWADGAYLLDASGRLQDTDAWSVLAAVMTAVAFALAGVLDSGLFAAVAAVHLAIFAGVLGAWLHTGSPPGPAVYAMAVALAASALAFAGHRWRRERLGIPFAVHATMAVMLSALAGVALVDRGDYRAFGAAWPYGAAAVAAVAALALSPRYGVFAALATGVVVAIVPTTEALIRHDDLGFLLAAVAIGFGVVSAAFLWPRLARDPGLQGAWVLAGIVSTSTAPSLLFLVKCWDKDGLDALTGPSGAYLVLLVVVSAALVAASYAFGRRARNKDTYRLLELAGLVQVFGTFTLQSLVRGQDVFYPLVVLGVGAVVLVVGATTRRATLVVLASAALVVNLSIQYFAKLWDVFPVSLLVMVFGIALLAGGVVYERRIKHLLPGLREWA